MMFRCSSSAVHVFLEFTRNYASTCVWNAARLVQLKVLNVWEQRIASSSHGGYLFSTRRLRM